MKIKNTMRLSVTFNANSLWLPMRIYAMAEGFLSPAYYNFHKFKTKGGA
jgi:hypothetical protein